MKKILLTIIVFSFSLGNDLLQEGVYPECSYVEVTADGWKIHKNWEGRVLSMKPPGTHNVTLGKYSFDKFGNLIPYTDCQSTKSIDNQTKTKVEFSLELDCSKLNC